MDFKLACIDAIGVDHGEHDGQSTWSRWMITSGKLTDLQGCAVLGT